MRPREYGFKVIREDQPPNKMVARFECKRCDATLDVTKVQPLNPEACARVAERAGWKADAFHPSVNRCPACRAKRGGGDKPEKEATAMPEPTKPPAQLREATPQERQRIRAILDRQFDDAAGSFLDGYSDQRIGEELNLPWAMVTKIREAAYGPIRVDPEVAGLRAEIGNAQRQIDAMSTSLASLKARLDALEKKRAA